MERIFLVLTIALIILFGTNLHAQKLTLGAKGGITMPGFTGGSAAYPLFSSNSTMIGGDFGIYGEYHLSRAFSISLGVEYSSEGGLNKFQVYPIPSDVLPTGISTYLYSDFNCETKLNYLLLPLLVRDHWKITDKISAYAGIGPFIGILIHATRGFTNSGGIFSDPDKQIPYSSQLLVNSYNGNTPLNSLDLGVKGLIGISYQLTKKEAVFIEAGATRGFTKIQAQASDGSSYNLAKVITIGYAYTFKERYKNRYPGRLGNY